MGRRRRIELRFGPDRERLTDRRIIVIGVLGGLCVAGASLFAAAPERLVREWTGIGARPSRIPDGLPSTPEEVAGAAIARDEFADAIKILRASADERPVSTSRAALLVAAVALSGDLPGATKLLEERLGPDDSETALAFASGETPIGDQRLDFMAGRWVVLDGSDTDADDVTIRRIAGGRAFIETTDRGRGSVSTVFVFDSSRLVWHRVLLTRTGVSYTYSGLVRDGSLTVTRRRENGRPTGDPLNMTFTPTSDGGFRRTYSFRTRDGDRLVVLTYTRRRPIFDTFGPVLY